MSLTYYDLYSDESGIDSGGSFYFGALTCSSPRARILRNALKEVKIKYDWQHELRFSGLPSFELETYKAFVQVFLDDRYVQFTMLEVKKDAKWSDWASSEEEFFFKSYYGFLRRNINVMYYKYSLYPDFDSARRPYRWSSLEFAINNGLRRDFDHLAKRRFVSVCPVNSKTDEMSQLVDVLLGAVTTTATSSHKVELSQYVRQRLRDKTRSLVPKPKFTILPVWTPDPTMKKSRN